MKPFKFFIFIFITLSVLKQIPAYSQCPENEIINLKKIAIVFGEKTYKYCDPLNNPINDANDISDSLEKVGFTVMTCRDADQKAMDDSVNIWFEKIQNYDVALFYFSGHGAEVKGENYLFPIDINPKTPSDLNYLAFSANKLLDRLASSNLKYSIIILDACRSNPFTKGWSRDVGGGGLAVMNVNGKASTFIAFAASPGKTASDGSKRNGTFTEGILKNITVPNMNIDEIFTKVNSYVRSSTAGEQVPFKNSSLGSEYCFSVTRTYKSTVNTKPSTFLQPASGILISQDEKHLFTVDDARGKLSVLAANTLDLTSTVVNGVGKPLLLNSRSNGNLFVADTVNHTISVIDWKSNKILQSFRLNYSPLAIIPSIDAKKLYSCGNFQGSGIVSIIDLQEGKVMKLLSIKNEVAKMIMSTDGKQLYISSKRAPGVLTIVDVRSEKPIKENNGIVAVGAIGITPDNKKLYASNLDSSQINVIDVSTYKFIKTIDARVLSFAFREDSKYAFALNETSIIMIRIADDEPVNKFPFVTPPRGLAFSNDGNGFVWLPQEKSVFTLTVSEQAKSSSNIEIDPEVNWKKFKEKVNSDPSLPEKTRRDSVCARLRRLSRGLYSRIISQVVNHLRSELNLNYSVKTNGPISTICEDGSANCSYGFGLAGDEKKSIYPAFNFKYIDGDVILTMKDDKIDKVAETFRFSLDETGDKALNKASNPFYVPLNETNENELKKFIRDYFIKRTDYLK